MHNPLHLPHEITSERPKVLRTRQFLALLTWKCASHCFAAQRHALFRHLNFKKCSKAGVLYTFDLETCFAPEPCTFSTSHLPKVVRTWCALYILTSKRASRHNGVHFSNISMSKSGLNLVCIVHFDLEMCFAPQRRTFFHLSPGQMAPHLPL